MRSARRHSAVSSLRGSRRWDRSSGRCCGSSLPRRKFDRDDIAGFIDLLPEKLDGIRLRHAIEPRHESFRDEKFFELCRARNIAIVLEDSDDYPLHRGGHRRLRLRAAAADERGCRRPAMTTRRSTASPSVHASGKGRPRRLHLHDQRRQGARAGSCASPAGTASLSIGACAPPTSRSASASFAPDGRMGKAIAKAVAEDPRFTIDQDHGDVLIDFSSPDALRASLDRAVSAANPDPRRNDGPAA